MEGAFRTSTDVLRCEVETLGYPRAALFSFATAVLAYNAYAVVQAPLRAAHGDGSSDPWWPDLLIREPGARPQLGGNEGH